MATTNKILGAAMPGVNTYETLYQVPANTQATASVFISNQDSSLDDSVWVMLVPSGQSPDPKYCVIGNGYITAGTALSLAAFALGAGDAIHVKSQEGLCSFVSTGLETV